MRIRQLLGSCHLGGKAGDPELANAGNATGCETGAKCQTVDSLLPYLNGLP